MVLGRRGATVSSAAFLISRVISVWIARMTGSFMVSCASGCNGVHMPLLT